MQRKVKFGWTLLSTLVAALFLASLTQGSVEIPFTEIVRIIFGSAAQDPIWTELVWDFRLTKTITCMLVGSALALGGLQMQTIFRNPLAGPDVLGLSAGASLAVSLLFMGKGAGVLTLSLQSPWAVALAASAGSASVFLLMIVISKRLTDSASLLIVGLMIGAGTSAIVSVLQYLSTAEEMQVYMIWTFGSLSGLNWAEIRLLALLLTVGLGLALLNRKALNVWVLGDNYAVSMGIRLERSRFLSILSTSILTGGVTAFCGPIAFVGLAVPHLVKLVIKSPNHKALIPGVVLGGAALVLACDILAQLPGSASILPINAITALFGAPVVIWVIMRNKVVR